jgi:hypothetical protein
MLEYAQTKEGGGHGGGIGVWEFHEVTAREADPADAFEEWLTQTRAWQAHELEKKLADMAAAEAAAAAGGGSRRGSHSSRRGSVRRGSRRPSKHAPHAGGSRRGSGAAGNCET